MNASLERGRIVGDRFRLIDCLGEGGMGQVWSASHLLTKKIVALKFIKTESEVARKRFLREAMAASAVRHRNVVQVHDVLEDGAQPFIVMDYLEGDTLETRIRRRGRLPLDEAANIMLMVISAVGTAHSEGIIHRDLKPANIFLTKDDHPIVLDFGIAKIVSDEDDVASSALTRGGSIIGTPHYMAPEQLFGESIDHRIDIWALGAVFYECLSGARPTPGENVGQILKTLVSGRIAPIEKAVPDLPEELATLIMRMLRPRAQRPALDELMRALRPHCRVTAADFGAPRIARQETTGGSAVVAPSHAETATATLEIGAATGAPVARSTRASGISRRSGIAIVAAVIAASAFGIAAIRVKLRTLEASEMRRDAAASTTALTPPELARTMPAPVAEARTLGSAPPAAEIAIATKPESSATARATPSRGAAPPSRKPKPSAGPAASAAPVAGPPSGANGAPILD